MSGRRPCVASAVPDSSPPPPTGATTTSRSAISSTQLERGGAGAGDHRVVVERVDLGRAGAGHDLGERLGARLGRVLART